jgi:hypothetical protein
MVSNFCTARLYFKQNCRVLTKIHIPVALQHVNFWTDVMELDEVIETYLVQIS